MSVTFFKSEQHPSIEIKVHTMFFSTKVRISKCITLRNAILQV
jgi:hypothetical protein